MSIKNTIITNRSSLSTLQEEIERNLPSQLKVPERLNNPDRLVSAAKDSLINQKPDNYKYNGTVSCSGVNLDIRVAVENISRALRFMDTLIKAIRARGHDIQIKNNKTCVIVEGHDFEILLREKMKKESRDKKIKPC